MLAQYHAVAKQCTTFAGGTDLKAHLAQYIVRFEKKWKVHFKTKTHEACTLFLHSEIVIDTFINVLFPFNLQTLIEDHLASKKITFEAYQSEIATVKSGGDELSLLLMAKMLRRNITVITAYSTWHFFNSAAMDIVLGYNGKKAWLATCRTDNESKILLINLYL